MIVFIKARSLTSCTIGPSASDSRPSIASCCLCCFSSHSLVSLAFSSCSRISCAGAERSAERSDSRRIEWVSSVVDVAVCSHFAGNSSLAHLLQKVFLGLCFLGLLFLFRLLHVSLLFSDKFGRSFFLWGGGGCWRGGSKSGSPSFVWCWRTTPSASRLDKTFLLSA